MTTRREVVRENIIRAMRSLGHPEPREPKLRLFVVVDAKAFQPSILRDHRNVGIREFVKRARVLLAEIGCRGTAPVFGACRGIVGGESATMIPPGLVRSRSSFSSHSAFS